MKVLDYYIGNNNRTVGCIMEVYHRFMNRNWQSISQCPTLSIATVFHASIQINALDMQLKWPIYNFGNNSWLVWHCNIISELLFVQVGESPTLSEVDPQWWHPIASQTCSSIQAYGIHKLIASLPAATTAFICSASWISQWCSFSGAHWQKTHAKTGIMSKCLLKNDWT
jgi:hypothetical protein